MSHDDNLIVSCPCGRIEIVKKGGYHTSSIVDAARLGHAASFLCRHRLRWLMRAGAVLMVVMISGVAVTAWVDGVKRARNEEAANLCRIGETKLDNGDDLGAIDAFTKSLAVHPLPLTYLIRGFAYYQLCDYRKAIADCDAALALDPANKAAEKNKLMILDRMAK